MKNITKEEILNSEIGKELMIKFFNCLQKDSSTDTLYERFKQEQLKQKVDWEILSFKGNDGRINPITTDGRYPCNPNCHENPIANCCHTKEYFLNKSKFYSIYSIKRLSDNCVFTLGDKIQYMNNCPQDIGTITEFKINGGFAEVSYETKDKQGWNFLNRITKAKTPLFKDFLGNDVFEGDKFYYSRDKDTYVLEASAINGNMHLINNQDLCLFKNKSDAEEYLCMHSKVLSLNDVKAYQCNPITWTLEEHLKQLIRQKLKIT